MNTADGIVAALSAGGWTVMILSLGFVLSLTIFCFYRVVTSPGTSEHIQDPLEIDTHDRDT
jgi:hypothetical protein